MTWTTWLPDAIAAAAAGATALTWREMRRDRQGSSDDRRKSGEGAALDARITVHVAPLEDRVRDIELTRTPDATRAIVRSENAPLMAAITSLETKVDLFWKAVAVDVAKILHQPDPRRARVDSLLESFLAGTLSDEERGELRGYLEQIRDWEPGKASGFPIRSGEQVAAAILLATMDYALAQGGPRRA